LPSFCFTHLVISPKPKKPAYIIALQQFRGGQLPERGSWEDRVAAGRMSMLKMPVLPVQGGLPIVVDGYCIGAIGVSGVQSHEDEQIAEAAIRAVLSGLN
jgi:uncharacterized protein GlcG (DUF336 family)